MTTDELEARVRAWIEDDPEAIDREELERLLADGETAELQARFAGPLQFGTAGLRGAIGAGPGRMNRATVARATAGLCAHLLEALPDAQARGVTIGYDGRHRSRAFAEEAAAVAAGAGFRVQLFGAPVPTPVLAFALVELKAAGGVMVTASHNPKDDNGFKVYWHNGAQIIPPVDVAIAAAMEAVASIRGLPRVDEAARRQRRLQDDLAEAMEQHYLDAVAELAAVDAAPPSIGVAYTAMHGVGQRFVEPALDALGYVELHSVPQQAEPDPDFPTAAFPNPEEEGAMDLVLALGEARGAALVLANDPDADRLAVAARGPGGGLDKLTGNELGALLAEDLLRRHGGEGATVLYSIVSTPLVARICAAHGAHHEATLTGFKWIGNRALELRESRGLEMVLGFEEALGYTSGLRVRDKDGVAAAVLTARMAAEASARGQSLFDLLDGIYREHGVFISGQVSLRLTGADPAAQRAALMARVRESRPQELAGYGIEAVLDLKDGTDTLPAHDAVFMDLAGGHRVAVRPSGTEPKVKLYLDVCEAVGDAAVADARTRAGETLARLEQAARAWLAPD